MDAVNQGLMDQARPATLVRQARIAGLCYLLVIAGGLFAEVVVRASLVVPGDAAATARAIAANETLWRWGVAVHLLYLVPAIVTNVLICGLFRAVEPTLARLALVFSVAGVMVEAASLLHLYLARRFDVSRTTPWRCGSTTWRRSSESRTGCSVRRHGHRPRGGVWRPPAADRPRDATVPGDAHGLCPYGGEARLPPPLRQRSPPVRPALAGRPDRARRAHRGRPGT